MLCIFSAQMVFRVYASAFSYYSTMPGSKECLWLLGDGLVQVKTPERRDSIGQSALHIVELILHHCCLLYIGSSFLLHIVV